MFTLKSAKEFLASAVIPTQYKNCFHYDVPTGFLGDPNGCVEAFGCYHVFYQHHPFAATNGDICWGHAVTKDFIHWQTCPPAIAPDLDYDRTGCWSGGALFEGGRLFLFYTGNSDGIQQICLAYSDDGITFVKYENNPIITTDMQPQGGDQYAFRDPYVVKAQGKYYMFIGNKDIPEDCGRTLLYVSENLYEWQYVGVVYRDRDGVHPGITECPCHARVDGADALFMSLNFMPDKGDLHRNFAETVALVGRLNYDTAAFVHGEKQLLDYGFDSYATQVMKLSDGRTISLAWMQMWEVTWPTAEYGWVGSFGLPRQVCVRNGKVYQTPIEEIQTYCVQVTELSSVSEYETEFRPVRLQIKHSAKDHLTLKFSDGISEYRYEWCPEESRAVITRGGILPQSRNQLESNTHERIVPIGRCDTISLDIFLDTSAAEIFFNDGEYVASGTYFMQKKARITLSGPCRLKMSDIKV